LNIIVTRTNFVAVLSDLGRHNCLAIDTETTGLRPHGGDRLFSIIISSAVGDYYFNFQPAGKEHADAWLLKEHKLALQAQLFDTPERLWIAANAKYDMHMLANDGLELAGTVFCTQAQGRVLRNDLFQYGLDGLCKRWLKEEKSDLAKVYCEQNHLWTEFSVEGRKKPIRKYHFQRIPLPVIAEYGCQDGNQTLRLGIFINEGIAKRDSTRESFAPALRPVSDNEAKLTKVLFKMERRGVLLDRPYVDAAYEHETKEYRTALVRYKELAGKDYVDSGSSLGAAFVAIGITPPKTDAGNWSITDDWLDTQTHELARTIQRFRKCYKKANTYYSNFRQLVGADGRIHPDFRQGGTATGRLSCSDPNLQNLEKEPDPSDKFVVRKSFIAPPDFCFFMPDYEQMEYRMMLDYAGEKSVIDQVLAGVDVHEATAAVMGVTRQAAKTINFMLLYGGGIAKLAATLRISESEARKLYYHYFGKLPKVGKLIDKIRETAKHRHYTFNWYGRRYEWPRPEHCHTQPPNYLIQGGCADAMKIAMVRIDERLAEKKARSGLVLTVHDELPTELHKNELELGPEIVKIMESVYPHKYLPLTASAEFSWGSLADKVKGYPGAA